MSTSFQLNQRHWLTLKGHYALHYIAHVFRSPPQKSVNEDRTTLSVAIIVARGSYSF